MSRHKDPAEQLARELAREAGYLPDRWRAWLLDQLRRDHQAADLEQQRIDQLNQRMSDAAAVLNRAAEHLRLTEQADQLTLKMREFDAAPSSVRGDWTARRVAEAIRGSWRLAKAVAFTNEPLPVAAERKYERAKGLARKRRESGFALSAVADWLATEPTSKAKKEYERWRREQTSTGKRSIPSSEAIRGRLSNPLWKEIVAAVEAGQLSDEQVPDEKAGSESVKQENPRSRRRGSRGYVLDPDLRARLIHEGREAKGLTGRQLAKEIGVDPGHLGRVERGEIKQTTFETIVKLAIALDLSLDDFATRD